MVTFIKRRFKIGSDYTIYDTETKKYVDEKRAFVRMLNALESIMYEMSIKEDLTKKGD